MNGVQSKEPESFPLVPMKSESSANGQEDHSEKVEVTIDTDTPGISQDTDESSGIGNFIRSIGRCNNKEPPSGNRTRNELLKAITTNNLDKIEKLCLEDESQLCNLGLFDRIYGFSYQLINRIYRPYHSYPINSKENGKTVVQDVMTTGERISAETIKLLLQLGADPFIKCQDLYYKGYTLLHFAVKSKNFPILEVVVNYIINHAPEQINAITEKDGNAFSLILEPEEFTEFKSRGVKLLLEAGVDVNISQTRIKELAKSRARGEKFFKEEILSNEYFDIDLDSHVSTKANHEHWLIARQLWPEFLEGDFDSNLLEYCLEKKIWTVFECYMENEDTQNTLRRFIMNENRYEKFLDNGIFKVVRTFKDRIKLLENKSYIDKLKIIFDKLKEKETPHVNYRRCFKVLVEENLKISYLEQFKDIPGFYIFLKNLEIEGRMLNAEIERMIKNYENVDRLRKYFDSCITYDDKVETLKFNYQPMMVSYWFQMEILRYIQRSYRLSKSIDHILVKILLKSRKLDINIYNLIYLLNACLMVICIFKPSGILIAFYIIFFIVRLIFIVFVLIQLNKSYALYADLAITFTITVLWILSTTNDFLIVSSIYHLLLGLLILIFLGNVSWCCHYAYMLQKISWNFLKFIVWYSVIIIMFSLSFYKIFDISSYILPETYEQSCLNIQDKNLSGNICDIIQNDTDYCYNTTSSYFEALLNFSESCSDLYHKSYVPTKIKKPCKILAEDPILNLIPFNNSTQYRTQPESCQEYNVSCVRSRLEGLRKVNVCSFLNDTMKEGNHSICHLKFDDIFRNNFKDVCSEVSSFWSNLVWWGYKSFVMITGENVDENYYKDYPFYGRVLLMVYVFSVVIILMNMLTGLALNDVQKIKTNAKLYTLKTQINAAHLLEQTPNLKELLIRLIAPCEMTNIMKWDKMTHHQDYLIYPTTIILDCKTQVLIAGSNKIILDDILHKKVQKYILSREWQPFFRRHTI